MCFEGISSSGYGLSTQHAAAIQRTGSKEWEGPQQIQRGTSPRKRVTFSMYSALGGIPTASSSKQIAPPPIMKTGPTAKARGRVYGCPFLRHRTRSARCLPPPPSPLLSYLTLSGVSLTARRSQVACRGIVDERHYSSHGPTNSSTRITNRYQGKEQKSPCTQCH